jgi:hypothetical protein
MQSATGLGGHLVFFLFLLIPGYVLLRAYLWANIALDDIGRLDKLVYMTVGGFVTIVIVAILRRMGFSGWLWTVVLGQHFPDWLALSVSELSIRTVSRLSIVESFTLVSSQSVVGIVSGTLYGLLKYVFFDDHRQKRRDLEQPWDMVFHETKVGNEVTVVTAQNREIEGILEQIGSPSKDYDLLISNPKEVIRDGSASVVDKRSLGNTSYHHYQDISRIEFDQDLIPEQETSFYLRQLQKMVGKKNEWYEKMHDTLENLLERRDSDQTSDEELAEDDDAPSLELEDSDSGDGE